MSALDRYHRLLAANNLYHVLYGECTTEESARANQLWTKALQEQYKADYALIRYQFRMYGVNCYSRVSSQVMPEALAAHKTLHSAFASAVDRLSEFNTYVLTGKLNTSTLDPYPPASRLP